MIYVYLAKAEKPIVKRLVSFLQKWLQKYSLVGKETIRPSLTIKYK